jgi:Family of unknown function (DUF6603)
MTNQLDEISLALLDFVEPLRRRLDAPDALEYLFFRYGWNATMDDAAFARFQQAAPFIQPLEQFAQTAGALRQKLATDGAQGLDPSEVATLAESAATLVRALIQFGPPNLNGLPDPLAKPEFWESIAEQVFDDLLEEYLRVYQPVVYLVLRLWNVIRYDETSPTEPGRVPYTRVSFDWSQAGDMLETPLQALEHAYYWGDATQPFDHRRAVEAMARVLGALRVPAALFSPALTVAPFGPDGGRAVDDEVLALRATLHERYYDKLSAFYRLGFEIYPAARTGEAAPTGLMVKPLLEGGGGTTLPLNELLNFRFAATALAGDVIGFAVFPGEADVVGGAPSIGTSLELATSGAGPWYALGNARTSHLEITGFSAKASLEGSLADPEILLRLACAGPTGEPGMKGVVTLDDADSFVQGTVRRSDIEFAFSPELVWSNKTGLAFNGNPKLDINLPLSIGLGPVTLLNATVALGKAEQQTTSAAGIGLRVGVGVRGTFGPVTVVVDNVGFLLTITPYSRQDATALPAGAKPPALGSVDVDLQFAPPRGLGLSIDAGIVSGGGYLGVIEDGYAGAFDLKIADVAVKAYGLVQTKLPGNVPGYSFVAVISAEFSPPFELSFGFTLDGVGGLLGINRTIAEDAVESALWAHHLDGLLFPKDPIATAPQLISALQSYFPAAGGRYIFGPMAKIGWGEGIAVGDVALILELPEPLKLLLVGEVAVGVPVQHPQLELHVSFAGGLDLGKKLAFFDATLHDSRIAGYPITGDLAFRYDWGDQPVLAFSLGGFHPHFQPPANFPTLKRLAITIGSSVAQLETQAYIAITSNTLQFGARVELTAGTGSFNVHGWLAFDALCEKHPLSIAFDLSAGVDLRHGTSVLASVHLEGHLTGPTPWHIAGEASLSLFFFDITVHFDKTWGSIADVLATLDPLPELLAALANRSSWNGALPPGWHAVVTTVAAPPDAGELVLLDPSGSLRIGQKAAPLGRPITRFGGAPLGRTLQFTIDNLNVFGGGVGESRPTTEEFAPAQFFEFSDAEKLSLPSFSNFDAGVEIGHDAVDVGQSPRTRAMVTPLVYDTTIVDSLTVRRRGAEYVLGAATLLALDGSAGGPQPGLDRYRPPPGVGPRVVLAPDRWVVAGSADLALEAAVGDDGTKLGAQLALSQYLSANPDKEGQLQVVLAGETA